MKLRVVISTTAPMVRGPSLDRCWLQQYEEQVASLKTELSDISRYIVSLREGDADLSTRETNLDKALFHVCLKIKRLFHTPTPSPSPPAPKSGVKLPKLIFPPLMEDLIM